MNFNKIIINLLNKRKYVCRFAICIMVVIILIQSIPVVVNAAYGKGYKQKLGDDMQYIRYTGSDVTDSAKTWGIKINDLNKLNGHMNISNDYYYHALDDIGNHCAYASITDNAANQNNLQSSFWWNPNKYSIFRKDKTPVLWRMVYMQLYDLRGSDKYSPIDFPESVSFGSSNNNVMYICYELNKNGKLLTNVGISWKKTSEAQKIINPDGETRYLLFYFKYDDGDTTAGSTKSMLDMVPEMVYGKYNKDENESYLIIRPFTLYLDKNGGTGGLNGSSKNDIVYEAYKSAWYKNYEMSVKINKIIPPKRTGYTFQGYYDNGTKLIDAGGKFLGRIAEYDYLYDRNGDKKTIKASWKANQYNIKYDLQGGSFGEKHPTKITYDQTFEVSHPSKKGYIFDGWQIEGMDTSEHIRTVGTTEYKWNDTYIKKTKAVKFKNLRATAGTVTYKAKWVPASVTIKYNPNNGKKSYSKVYTYGQKNQKVDELPVWNGFKCLGWYQGNIKRTAGATISNDKFIDVYKGQTVVFDAKWNNTVTIVYHRNYTSTDNVTSTIAYTYGTAGKKYGSGWSRTGYKGTGWSKTANGSTNFSLGANVDDNWIKENGGKTIHLYQKWSENQVSIVYHRNTLATDTVTSTVVYKYSDSSVTRRFGYKNNGKTSVFGTSWIIGKTDYILTGWNYAGAVNSENDSAAANARNGTFNVKNNQNVSQEYINTYSGKTMHYYAATKTFGSYNVYYHQDINENECAEHTGSFSSPFQIPTSTDSDASIVYKYEYGVATPLKSLDEITLRNGGSFVRKGYNIDYWTAYRGTSKLWIYPDYSDKISYPGKQLLHFSPNQQISGPVNIGSEIHFVAHWKPKQVRVIFHRNRSDDDMETSELIYTYGVENQYFKDFGFTNDGYNMAGWSLTKDAAVKKYNTDSYVTDEWIDSSNPEIHLYAVWKPKTLTINFHRNIYSGDPEIFTQIYYHSSLSEYDEEKSYIYDASEWEDDREGYHIVNWKNGIDGSVYEIASSIDDDFIETYKNKEAIDLYLQWDDTYNLSIDANGGVICGKDGKTPVSLLSIKYKYGYYRYLGYSDEAGKLYGWSFNYGKEKICGQAYREGYKFTGWKIYMDGVEVGFSSIPSETDYDTSYVKVINPNAEYWHKDDELLHTYRYIAGSNANIWGFNGMYACDVVLEAQWSQCEVTYFKNKPGSEDDTSKDIVYQYDVLNQKIYDGSEWNNDYEGYSITGWQSKDEDGNVISTYSIDEVIDNKWFDEHYKEKCNLYAIWTPNKYKLTIELNGGSCYLWDGTKVDGIINTVFTYGEPYVISTDSTTKYSLKIGAVSLPLKKEYEFKKWTIKTGGTESQMKMTNALTEYGMTNVYQYDGMSASDVTIEAEWTPAIYTVRYFGNGSNKMNGDGTAYQMEASIINRGISDSLKSNEYTKIYKIRYDTKGGKYKEKNNPEEKIDFEFLYWLYDDPENTSIKYEDKQQIGPDETVKYINLKGEKVVDLYAQWKAETIVFGAPKKDGCIFKGWLEKDIYDEIIEQNKIYSEKELDGLIADYVYDEGENYIPVEDKTFCAVWYQEFGIDGTVGNDLNNINSFYKGDSGKIFIDTFGFVEEIEISFDNKIESASENEAASLNRVKSNGTQIKRSPTANDSMEYAFKLPQNIDSGMYVITIVAHRNGEQRKKELTINIKDNSFKRVIQSSTWD